jgi:hypothetical protein
MMMTWIIVIICVTMCNCVCVCVCVCVCARVHTFHSLQICMQICKCACVRMYVCLNTRTRTRMYILHVCTCTQRPWKIIYVYMCGHMSVCVYQIVTDSVFVYYVCIYICMYVCIH